MTDTPNLEWDDWQAAWRSEPSAPADRTVPLVAELRRRLLRHRRTAWAYTALDGCAAVLLVGLGVYALIARPALPVVVWAVGLFAFTAIALGYGIWNRRDALWYSAQSTADFLAALRVRLERRERVPRFLVRFAAAEIGFGAVYFAIWSPRSIALAAVLYGAIAAALAVWWRWYRERLRQERAQLDALSR